MLVDAFTRVRAAVGECRLVVVGTPVLGQDGYAAGFRARVAATPGAQLLDGRDDIPDVMADLDVLAFPSVEPESYGLVLVEALASGTPVVATDHGGPPEIVARADPGAGRVVAAGDAGALAAAVLDLLPARTSPERRRARLPGFTPPAAALRRGVPRRRGCRPLTDALGPGVHAFRSLVDGRIGGDPGPQSVLGPLLDDPPEPRRHPQAPAVLGEVLAQLASVCARPLSAYFVT